MPLAELFSNRFASCGEKTALVCGDRDISYAELSRMVSDCSFVLQAHSTELDVIGVESEGLEFVVVYLAAAVSGRALNLGARSIGSTDAGMSASATVVAGGTVDRLSDPHIPWRSEVPGFAVVLETSGTTGSPKRIVHDSNSLTFGLWNTASVADELLGSSPEDPNPTDATRVVELLASRSPHGLAFLSGMPLRSIAGLSVLNRALAMGETLVIPSEISAAGIGEEIARGVVTNVGVPPITAHNLLRIWEHNPPQRSSLLSFGIGGGSVSPEVASRLEGITGCNVTSGYGSTELGGVALMSRPWDTQEDRWHTIGRPLRSVVVELGAESGSFARLSCTSPASMVGTIDQDGALIRHYGPVETGDTVSAAASGAIAIHGRADFVIQRGGRRIDPATIENVLDSIPSVQTSAVLGLPSRIAGEQDVVALVVFGDDVPDVDAECRLVRRSCVGRLQPHEIPRRIIAVKYIPRARDGGPRRHLLPNQLPGA